MIRIRNWNLCDCININSAAAALMQFEEWVLCVDCLTTNAMKVL